MAAVQNIRNLALCGHGSAGKTTLADVLLVKTGAVNANPSDQHGRGRADRSLQQIAAPEISPVF